MTQRNVTNWTGSGDAVGDEIRRITVRHSNERGGQRSDRNLYTPHETSSSALCNDVFWSPRTARNVPHPWKGINTGTVANRDRLGRENWRRPVQSVERLDTNDPVYRYDPHSEMLLWFGNETNLRGRSDTRFRWRESFDVYSCSNIRA